MKEMMLHGKSPDVKMFLVVNSSKLWYIYSRRHMTIWLPSEMHNFHQMEQKWEMAG